MSTKSNSSTSTTSSTTTPTPKPPSSNLSDTILPLITIILIALFIVYIIYVVASGYTSGLSTRGTNAGGGLYIECGPGQCPTNLVNGTKRCPVPGQSLLATAGQEVCNSAQICDSPITPYAVWSDGSTNLQGVCEAGINCPCVRTPTCANYVTSIWNAVDGNPYQPFSGQRISFQQTVSQPPIGFTNAAVSFCSIPVQWLPLSSPGCAFTGNMTCADIAPCMDVPNVPCMEGTLAIIGDPTTITSSTVLNSQVSCVRGTPCPSGQVAVWNPASTAMQCVSLTC